MSRFLSSLLLALLLAAPLRAEPADIYAKSNLAAWCIVPFDAKKRTPSQRAEMVKRLGLTKVAYDWRQEHVAEFEQEILEYKKHGLEFFAFWATHEEAFKLFEKYDLHPQIWVSLGGGAGPTHEDQVKAATTAMLGVVERTRKAGCKLGLYNHGGWGGEPENQIAVCEYLRKHHQADHVGIVYNLHHGHGHLDRLDKVLPAMLSYLLCVNINGMDIGGDAKGRKILPLGAGGEDVRVLKVIRASGYKGPVGILNHTNQDAEGRLLDNLDGLDWLLPQLDGKPAGPKPKYRTWSDKPAAPPPSAATQGATGVQSLAPEFGKALSGRMVVEGKDAYRTLPITIECRAKLNSKDRFNILIACDPKSSSTHWELYTYAGRGGFSVYLPGRGGEFKSTVNICDGQWHDLLASIDETAVTLWVDGKQVLEKAPAPLRGTPHPGSLAFGGLVEGNIGCDGVIDDVRISRGAAKPKGGSTPRQLSDMTLGLWNFDNLSDKPVVDPPKPKGPSAAAFTPERKPLRVVEYPHWEHFVNRDRVFDFYAKEVQQFMAQKPVPELLPEFPGLDGGKIGHWGNQNDATTWRDARWSKSDLGDVFSSVFTGAKLTVPKSVCIRLGDNGEMSACFDPEALTFPVVWKDGFLKLSDARHGFMSGGKLDGTVVEQAAVQKPADSFVYRGFYRHGKRVLFGWKQGDTEMLDTAWCSDGQFSRTTAPRAEHPLRDLADGGPAQWPLWIEMRGTVGNDEPFATDTIPVPFENPYGTLFFLSGHDFFRDGTAAVATMTGEVWLVRGLDAKLERVRWKRFATGLHQPLGVKIVNDELYVLGRDQITRLHDLNGDDEADFYECVTNVQATSAGGHSYITGLDCDAQGRFYFASANQGVCRVGRTGAVEVLATGFRNPNGLGLSTDGTVTTSVQEGDWTPASAICQITTAGLHFGAGGPKNGQPPEPPLLYMPRGEDNSSGGQCFITGDTWAALRVDGNFVHLSPGSGSAFLVMRQQVNGRWQGAAMRISGGFDSGAQAGRFHPIDGQFYATGMTGWGSYTPMDGCFQRVRFTGGKTPVPVAFEARDNGVLLRFDRPLDASFVAKAASHFAQCWNYRYSAAYGSPEFSVRYPDTAGHDPLEIRSAQVLDAGRTLFLEIPQLVTASQIHLHVGVTADRAHDLFLTAHALAPVFKDFPGYQPIAKTPPPSASIATVVPPPAKPNPWAKGEPGRAIVIEAALGLQFAQKQFAVKAGERVSLTFTNPDVVPHNWVLAKPGTFKSLGEEANKLITDPTGLARHYIPESPDVIVYTDMANPAANFTIHFTAPDAKGDYPYLCTFPGHWMVMNGVMTVE